MGLPTMSVLELYVLPRQRVLLTQPCTTVHGCDRSTSCLGSTLSRDIVNDKQKLETNELVVNEQVSISVTCEQVITNRI